MTDKVKRIVYDVFNPKVETIIATGGVYVLDENYNGECIQIGGTKNNTPSGTPTILYIKCWDMDENGEMNIKFVRVCLTDPGYKFIIKPDFLEVVVNEKNCRDIIMKKIDTKIYITQSENNPHQFDNSFVAGYMFNYLKNMDSIPYYNGYEYPNAGILDRFDTSSGIISAQLVDNVTPNTEYWVDVFDHIHVEDDIYTIKQ